MRCPGCGLETQEAAPGCQALFDELIARDFSDYRYGRHHRLAVDVYALQHAEKYGKSAKSFAAHLAGLCCAMEHDRSQPVYQTIQRWLNGRSPVERPKEPASRGAVTIADALAAMDPDAYGQAVARWASSTWEAYADLHPLARQYVADAMSAK